MNKPLFEKHKDIARIDQEAKRTFGWYVRVRFKGKTYAKFFSDKKRGGRHSALRSAVSWRDDIEKKIGKPRSDKHLVTKSRSKSGTGVVGVRYNEKLSRYEVSWVDDSGKQCKTSVSVRKHGKGEAFKIACEKRESKERIGSG